MVRRGCDELDEEVGLGPPEDVVRLVPERQGRVTCHQARQRNRRQCNGLRLWSAGLRLCIRRCTLPSCGVRDLPRLRGGAEARSIANQPEVGRDERVGRRQVQRRVGRVGCPACERGGIDGRAPVGGAVPA